MQIESIWTETTCTCIPREGDYVCVSHKNIKDFAEAIINKCADVAFKNAPTAESGCDVADAIEEYFEIEE